MFSTIIANADNGKLYDGSFLSSSLTSTLCQDSHGYIWIGTEYGVNKFDGYRFTQYLSHQTDTTTIQDNEITAFFIDSKNNLWIGMSKGLARYDYMTNRFVRYSFGNSYRPRVSAIVEKDGNLLIGTSGYGVYTLVEGETMLRETPLGKRIEDNFCSKLFIDRQGNIWRSSHLHLITRYSKTKDGTYRHKDYPLQDRGPAVSFIDNGEKEFWIVCMYGILKYDYATQTLSDAEIDLSMLNNMVSIRAACIDANGNLLVGTSGAGIMMVPHGKNTLINAFTYGDDKLLHTTNVNDILCDKDGGVWISCYGKGLFKIGGGKQAFYNWTFYDNDIKLGSRISSCVYCNDAVWCTVLFGGLYRFGKDGKGLRAMNCPQGTNLVYCDRQGQMWVCTENALYSYSPNGKYKLMARTNGLGLNTMTDDGNGKLYISNFGRGLFVFDTKTGKGRNYSMADKPIGKKWNTLHNDWIRTLYVLDNRLLLVGTTEGMQTFNMVTREFGVPLMEGIQCTAMLQTDDSHVLVGTSAGLYTYNLHSAEIRPLANAKMLQDKQICAMRKDEQGNVWISTTAGIWMQSPKDGQWHGYVLGNGLVTKEYITRVSIVMPDGRIGFATADGITFFNPDSVVTLEERTYDAVLSNIIISGNTVSPFKDKYVLAYDENNVSLDFSTMTYYDTEDIAYEYRINGKGDWKQFAEGQNRLTFTQMPPGIYKIEVRTRNGNNVSKTTTITIKVRHPWYSSPLAYILYILFVLVIVLAGIAYYLRRKRAELDEVKMQFLINATHDMRSPLTLILGPLAKLRGLVEGDKQNSYIDIIERNTQRLLLLVNQVLDVRRIDKQQMELHCTKCDMNRFVGNICSLYKYRADEKGIKLNLEEETTPVEAWIDRIQFDKVVSNLLSNAFKYTPENGEIKVSLRSQKHGIQIEVTDNGIGIDEENREKLFYRYYQGRNNGIPQTQGTGIGLNLSKAIVEMHGGKITASNRIDGVRGACFKVFIPHGNGHLKPEYIATESMPSTATSQNTTRPSQRVRILVVDDYSDLTQYISNELGSVYRITTCTDGLEALHLLHRQTFDLVVSDVIMPHMDGIELLHKIKKNPMLNHIPVIMLTSKGEIEDRLEGLRHGADAYMAKPLNMEELQVQIANLIAKSRRLKGKFSGQLHTDDDAVKTPEVKGNDEALMERILKVINDNLGNSEFNVEMLASKVFISRVQLHRKMKEITGLSAGEYIRNIKMEHASRLIREGKINITQIAYIVGFNSQAHFSTVFKKHFGMSPTEFAEQGK